MNRKYLWPIYCRWSSPRVIIASAPYPFVSSSVYFGLIQLREREPMSQFVKLNPQSRRVLTCVRRRETEVLLNYRSARGMWAWTRLIQKMTHVSKYLLFEKHATLSDPLLEFNCLRRLTRWTSSVLEWSLKPCRIFLKNGDGNFGPTCTRIFQ